MPRKLMILSVATLVLLVASYLQAQECECLSKSSSAKSECQACQMALTTVRMALPGSTSFIDQQSEQLSDGRDELAIQLTEYLTNGEHEPAEIRRVLEMALDSTADEAHRHAMMLQGESNPLAMPLPMPPTRQKRFVSAEAAPMPLASSRDNPSAELQKMRRDQDSMRNVIQMLQQDMQKIALDVSQMHVESRMDRRNHQTMNDAYPMPQTGRVMQQATNWPSMPVPQNPDRSETVDRLMNRIQVLESQLRQIHSQQSPGQSANVRQTTLETPTWRMPPERLQPQSTSTMPLMPANVAPVRRLQRMPTAQPVVVVYYVGDLMAPPFAGATLQLMQHIKSNVAPATWGTTGQIEITRPSISLAIRQTPENQEKIAVVLMEIRNGTVTFQGNNRTRR